MNKELIERLRAIDEEAMYQAPASTYATINEAASMLEKAREVIQRMGVGLDDWLNTYADDLCDPARVAEARQRIDEYGTLAYIANIQERARSALKALEVEG